MLINQEINAGQMMAYLTATQMIQRSFAQLSILFGQVIRGLNSGGRVFEYLKYKSTIPIDDSGLKIDDLQGHIQFNSIMFRYPNRKEIVISFLIDLKSRCGNDKFRLK
jgi:ATP-binding cassette subfamily B (MDR/TAP) protein 8